MVLSARDAYEIFFLAQSPVWMRGLLIASGIAVASLALIYQPVKIEGNSMTPLLSNHEAIIINRLVYHFEPIRRGDVVVFRSPLDATKTYIKRILGLPGETVRAAWIQAQNARFGAYDGLANSPFHSLVFGINELRLGRMPYFGANHLSFGAPVQLLCTQNWDGLAYRCTNPNILIGNKTIAPKHNRSG